MAASYDERKCVAHDGVPDKGTDVCINVPQAGDDSAAFQKFMRALAPPVDVRIY